MITTLATVLGIATVAFGGVAHASDWTIDSNGDGYDEATAVDRWEDGTPDIVAFDSTLNRVWDGYGLDLNNDDEWDVMAWDGNENNVLEMVQFDLNYDGTFDSVIVDLNENGVPDSPDDEVNIYVAIQAATAVGPVTTPGGFRTIMTALAGLTEGATFGSGNYDGDAYFDNQDYYPTDPSRA